MKLKSIFPLLLASVLLTSCLPGHGPYRKEADHFLKNMPYRLQDTQSGAIRRAINGDVSALEKIRKGRNTEFPLNGNVEIKDVTPDLRLYRPSERNGEVLPLLVYFHGGGWTIGSIQSCARYCSELAATGKVMVLAVDYRLAPECPFPSGLQDCADAFAYACAHAADWGGSPDRVAAGGDSSGGNLAIATTLMAIQQGRQLPSALVLYYPVIAAWNDGTDSWKKYAEGAGLDGKLMESFIQAYCSGLQHPLISPCLASDADLSRLPRTLMVAAERDILHDQGKIFAERLQSLGVAVRREVLRGSVHLFVTVSGQEKAFRRAVASAEAFLSGEE